MESPQLLDPHLSSLLPPIFDALRPAIKTTPSTLPPFLHTYFSLVYAFTKVRGPDTILRFFPHAVSDVEPTLALLHAQDVTDPDTWETRYVLLLWASLLIMVPFDLDTIDSSSSLVDDLLTLAKAYLSDPGRPAEAAALVLAKALSRRDLVPSHLPPFLSWGAATLQAPQTSDRTRAGVLSALAEVFKRGLRSDLLPLVSIIYHPAIASAERASANSSSLILHHSVKLVHHIGLVFLPPTVAPWRYKRGGRTVIRSALSKDPVTSKNKDQDQDQDLYEYEYQEEYEYEYVYADADDDDDDNDAPSPPLSSPVDERVDAVTHICLQGLKARDTIVRWEAAKGIGKLSERLPLEFAADVVEAILKLLDPLQSDSAWHGACLALAELARRGLLLPSVLAPVIDRVLTALQFDELRGSHSVGAHVRDAGCYVAWAFARAYDAHVMAPHATRLATGLITMAVFDREVNCRRAASAAFQELVGRLGNVPHGIPILTRVDYFTVGSLSDAYLVLAPYVASYPEYAPALLTHVLTCASSHWDVAIRNLASQAIPGLFPNDPDYFLSQALPVWTDRTSSRSVASRHGALLALGHTLVAAAEAESLPEDYTPSDLIALIPHYTSSKRFRGIGGVLTRQAMVLLVGLVAQARLPLNADDARVAHAFLLESLRAPEVLATTLPVLHTFGSVYYGDARTGDEISLPVVTSQLLDIVKRASDIEPVLSGTVAAVGTLPFTPAHARGTDDGSNPLFSTLDTLIGTLLNHSGNAQGVPPATRRAAASSLTTLVSRVGLLEAAAEDPVSPAAARFSGVMDAFLASLSDYSRSKQGDVGSWVRMEAMRGIQVLCLAVGDRVRQGNPVPASWDASISLSFVSQIARQALEKIDRVRDLAGSVLAAITSIELPCSDQFLPQLRDLVVSPAQGEFKYEHLVHLLEMEEFALDAMTGLVVSVGDLAESVAKASSSALLGVMGDALSVESVVDLLLRTMEVHAQDARVIVPAFKTLDTLFTAGVMGDIDPDTLGTRIFSVLRAEVLKSRDLVKLLAAAPVFASMLMYPPPLASSVLRVLVSFLGHPYPKLRKEVADQLYLGLNTYEEHLPEDEDQADDVLDLLAESVWDGERADAIQARDPLYDVFGIPKPKPRPARGLKAKPKAKGPAESEVTGTYLDLVRSSGF